MSRGDDTKGRRKTLADALDATKWDYQPGRDKKILLRPAGSVFSELPWEIEPQYLGPALVREGDVDKGADSDPGVERPDDESSKR
jgi:hypothetical protein